jgi:hypothetical protein
LTVARRERLELEPGEEVLALARASFRGAAATSVRATFALGSARMRMRAFDQWHDAAIASGFPHVPPDMFLAATGQRVLFGRPTFWGRPPKQFSSALDLSAIAQVATTRHGLVTGVAFGMTHGAIVEVEALRGRALRHLVEVVTAVLPRH